MIAVGTEVDSLRASHEDTGVFPVPPTLRLPTLTQGTAGTRVGSTPVAYIAPRKPDTARNASSNGVNAARDKLAIPSAPNQTRSIALTRGSRAQPPRSPAR